LIELYVADETGLTMQPYVPYGWQKKGQRLGLPARIATKRINLLGLLRLDNQLTIYHSEKALTGELVVGCLADFVAKDHPKPIVIVLDNGWCATATHSSLSSCLRPTGQLGRAGHVPILFADLQSAPESDRNSVAVPKVSVVAEAPLQFMESPEKGRFYYHSLIWPRISYLF
jgi:hypothetical protein